MLRRFNYTGRKKIPRSAVSINVSSDGPTVPTFDAKFDLSSLKLPGHAKVYVEAYHHASYVRFDFGRISDVRPPTDRRLTDIEAGGTVKFRLKVIDETMEHGCILAEADSLTPLDGDEAVTNRISFFPVDFADLKDQIWRVNFFANPDGRPALVLNKNVEGVAQIALGDDHFFALCYPAAMRQILDRILRVEEVTDTDGPSDDWRVQWLKFSCNLPGILNPPSPDEEDDTDDSRQVEWIDDVVAAFCTHYKILERFNLAHSGEAD